MEGVREQPQELGTVQRSPWLLTTLLNGMILQVGWDWYIYCPHAPIPSAKWFWSGLNRYLNTEPHKVFGAKTGCICI